MRESVTDPHLLDRERERERERERPHTIFSRNKKKFSNYSKGIFLPERNKLCTYVYIEENVYWAFAALSCISGTVFFSIFESRFSKDSNPEELSISLNLIADNFGTS